MEQIIPLGDFILVRPEKRTGGVSPGGIVIPEGSGDEGHLARGEVLACGPINPKTNEELSIDVRAGDTVLYAKPAGLRFERGGEKLLLVIVSQLIAKVVAGDK